MKADFYLNIDNNTKIAMRYTEADYDYAYAKSRLLSVDLLDKVKQFKEENERDFLYDECDCNGSSKVSYEIKVYNNKKFRLFYSWYLNV